MIWGRKEKNLGRFDIKENLKKDIKKQYKLYFIIAVPISLVFSFFVFDDKSDIKNIYLDLSIPVIFTLIGLASLKNKWIDKNLKYLFFGFCLILSVYAYLIYVDSGYTLNNFFGFMIAFFAIMIGINDHRLSLIYSIFILTLIIIVRNIFPEHIELIGLKTEIICFLIIGVVGFIIHYKSYKSIKTILYNDGLLDSIINTTADGIFLLNKDNLILDYNKKAKELFKLENKAEIINKDFYIFLSKNQELKNGIIKFQIQNEELITNSIVKEIEYKEKVFKIITISDISQNIKKSNELDIIKQRLIESEKTYRELFNNSFDLIFITDTYFNIIDINKTAEAEIIKKEDEWVGVSLLDFIDEENHEQLEKLANNNLKNDFNTIKLFNKNYDINIRKTTYYDIDHYVIYAKSAENRLNYQRILKDSRDRMLMILENVNSIIYYQEVTKNGNVYLRYLSPKIEDFIGISVDEFITLTKAGKEKELFHPDDRKLIEEKRKFVSKNKLPVEFIYRVRKGDEYIWLEERIYPKFDEQGRHIANFGVTTDVTKSQLNQQALRYSNQKNLNFIKRNLAGFYSIDINKNILNCNDAFARIFGFDFSKDLIGKNINDLYIDSTDRHTFIEKLKQERIIINNESKIKLNNGKEIFILENASLTTDVDGMQLIDSTVFDITDLKNAELALEKSEEALSMILNNIDDLVYSVEFDDDGNRFFNYLGEQVEKITGFSSSEYIEMVNNKTIFKQIHPDDIPELNRRTEELKKEGKNQDFTYRFITKKNKIIWIEESVIPQFNQDGKLKRLFGVVREISEKKRFEDALRESEEKYRNLVENNSAGVFRTTIKGEILESNYAFSQIFGYDSIDEIKKINSRELYLTAQDRQDYIKKLSEKGFLSNHEIRHKKKDGSVLWVSANVNLIRDEKDNTEYIQGTLIDITDSKNSREALKESEEKFRLLFEATNDAILILEGDSVKDCNEKSLETFGCTLDQKKILVDQGSTLINLSPNFQPDGLPSKEKFDDKIREALAGNPQMFYWRFKKKDDTFFDAEVSLNLFNHENKKFIQVIIRDITARMKAEIALREGEERFKMLSNATIEGIIFSENGIIIDANDQFAFMHGYKSRSEVIGKNIIDFLYSQEDVKKVREVTESNSEEKFEVRSKHTDGKVIWLESKGRIIPYHGRRVRVSVVYDITDRKMNEEELQQSRKSFRDLTELSPNGSIIHINGRIEYANPQVIKFFGFNSLDDLIGKDIYDFLVDEEKQISKERIKNIQEGKNVGLAEFNVIDKNGNKKEIGVQSVLIDYNGKKAIHVIISDLSQQKELQKEKLRAQVAEETNILLEKEIQERKDAEQRLWETQMFTTNMFNSSLDMIMASDKSNLITQVNNAVLKTFGYKTEEIIGTHPKHLYADEKQFDKVKDSLIEKGSFSGEIINKKKSGESFISYLSASVLKNTQGKIIGTMGVSRDITESLLSQQKIQEQNAQIRSIFDSASNLLIWSIDKEYKLTSFNNNFKDIVLKNFGIEAEKGVSILNIINPFLKEELLKYSIDVIAHAFEGRNGELEGPFKTVSNETIWLETFLSPIFLEDGIVKEVSCISHEITEKKEIENQIRQSLKEKEVLLKEVHHRVKNNLQVISSILNLQSSYVQDDKTLSILRESQNRIKSMSFIHESLYQTKNFSSINFSEYIINLSNNLFHSYQIFDNFIELKFDIEQVELNLDQAIPCGLIVNEIITNAMKYAFVGKKEGQIFISIKEKKETIELKIEDDGVGLPKGFNHEKTASLGLQLVVTLIEQLDGKLTLESKNGTKYLITFDKLN